MIPSLDELSWWQRGLLLIVIVTIIILALLVLGRAEQRDEILYGDTPLDAVLIRLDKHALDTAYEQRIIRLWEVWISPTTRDPSAFTNGLKIARQRYAEAAAAIGRRERQLIENEQRHQQEQRK